jgi:hypothetical protein
MSSESYSGLFLASISRKAQSEYLKEGTERGDVGPYRAREVGPYRGAS